MPDVLARALRKRMTLQEVKLWGALRQLRPQGWHSRRQDPHPPFVLDFACRKARLAVEVDGSQHGFDAGRVRDAARDAALARAGWRTLRVWNGEVDRDLPGVVDTIVAALEGRL